MRWAPATPPPPVQTRRLETGEWRSDGRDPVAPVEGGQDSRIEEQPEFDIGMPVAFAPGERTVLQGGVEGRIASAERLYPNNQLLLREHGASYR